MLKDIKVRPIAAESLGVRSMCTYVETPDVKILLDAGASLCPSRFGLPPHPSEFKAIITARQNIAEAAEKADLITLSHYHFDHHTPSYEDWLCNWTKEELTARQIYESKTVLIKNPREQINPSQRRRAWVFRKTGGKYAKKLLVADAKNFVFGETTVEFSKPVFHGSEDGLLGWILMTTIERQNERFLYAPDVQGPMSNHTLDLMVDTKPNMVMLGGPPLYLAGFKVSEKQIQTALQNLQKIVQRTPLTIIEHHTLRDEDWSEKLTEAFSIARASNHTIMTAAEYGEQKNSFLEATRKKLYSYEQPSEEFQKWMKLNEDKRKRSVPPI